MTEFEFSSPVLKIVGFGDLELSISIPSNCREAVENFVLEMKRDKKYCAILKEVRDKRTMSQNAYYWALNNKLAEQMRLSPVEVYKEHIKNMAGIYDYVLVKETSVENVIKNWERNGDGWLAFETKESERNPGSKIVKLYRGSSTFDKEEFARLLDLCIMDCESVGIPTLSREEIEAMPLND